MNSRNRWAVVAILVLGLCGPGGAAGPLQPRDLSKTGFEATDAMIPARDGVRLDTKIFVIDFASKRPRPADVPEDGGASSQPSEQPAARPLATNRP